MGKMRACLFLVVPGSSRMVSVVEVDLVPLEWQYFTQAAPTRDVGKPHDWLDVVWQVTQNFQELRVFEESLTNVVFIKHRDMRLPEKFSGLSCQTVRPLEGSKLSIDCTVRSASLLPHAYVTPNFIGREA